MSPDALTLLEEYSFPGNVRELENIIERAVVLCEGDIINRVDLELRSSEGESSAELGFVPPELSRPFKKAGDIRQGSSGK